MYQDERWQQEQMQQLDDDSDTGDEYTDAGQYGDQYGDGGQYGDDSGSESSPYGDQYGDSGQYGNQYGDGGQYGDAGQYGNQYGDAGQYGDQYGDGGQYGDGDQYGVAGYDSGEDQSGLGADQGDNADPQDSQAGFKWYCEDPSHGSAGLKSTETYSTLEAAQRAADAHNAKYKPPHNAVASSISGAPPVG